MTKTPKSAFATNIDDKTPAQAGVFDTIFPKRGHAMKLYVKQKVFSIGERFSVKDEYGNDRYVIDGEFFSIPKRFHIYDASGREVLLLQARMFSFLPCYEIIRKDTVAAEIVKEFSFFRPKYRIDGSPFSVDGDIFDHDYTILRDGKPCAAISKEWFTWGDSYMLDNFGNEDEEMLLAILIVIDCVLSQN